MPCSTSWLRSTRDEFMAFGSWPATPAFRRSLDVASLSLATGESIRFLPSNSDSDRCLVVSAGRWRDRPSQERLGLGGETLLPWQAMKRYLRTGAPSEVSDRSAANEVCMQLVLGILMAGVSLVAGCERWDVG